MADVDDSKLEEAYQYWHDCGFDEGYELGYSEGYEAASFESEGGDMDDGHRDETQDRV